MPNNVNRIFEAANLNSPWLNFSFDLTPITDVYPPKLFKRGVHSYGCNEQSEFVYVVISGQVENYTIDIDGHKKVTIIGGRGMFYGDISAIDGRTNYTGMHVLKDSMISCIPKNDFLPFILSNPALTEILFKVVAEKIRCLNSQLELSWFKDSPSKIAYILLSICRDYEPTGDGVYTVPFHLTHNDIANISGLNRVTVSKVLSSFMREGIITKIQPKKFQINVPKLQSKIKRLFNT